MGCAAIPASTLHAYCFFIKSADAKSQAGTSDWLSLGHLPALVAKEAGKVTWPFWLLEWKANCTFPWGFGEERKMKMEWSGAERSSIGVNKIRWHIPHMAYLSFLEMLPLCMGICSPFLAFSNCHSLLLSPVDQPEPTSSPTPPTSWVTFQVHSVISLGPVICLGCQPWVMWFPQGAQSSPLHLRADSKSAHWVISNYQARAASPHDFAHVHFALWEEESSKEQHWGNRRSHQACPPCHFPIISLETNPIPLASLTVKVAYPLINWLLRKVLYDTGAWLLAY